MRERRGGEGGSLGEVRHLGPFLRQKVSRCVFIIFRSSKEFVSESVELFQILHDGIILLGKVLFSFVRF